MFRAAVPTIAALCAGIAFYNRVMQSRRPKSVHRQKCEENYRPTNWKPLGPNCESKPCNEDERNNRRPTIERANCPGEQADAGKPEDDQ
jgi:hypothetical protein